MPKWFVPTLTILLFAGLVGGTVLASLGGSPIVMFGSFISLYVLGGILYLPDFF